MTNNSADFFKNMNESVAKVQEISEPIAKLHNQIHEMIRPYATLMLKFQKRLKVFEKIAEDFSKYREQLQQNFREIISVIEPPEVYVPSKVKLRGRVNLTILGMISFANNMDEHAFCHLKERMLIGINAHMEGNYHLSLFCIFTVIDGMLSWFYKQDHQENHTHMSKKLDKFFEVYAFEHTIGKNEMRPKFDVFVKHRNEIMHGGKNSHFDKNLSSAALFFLGIVYASLVDKAAGDQN